MSAKLLGDVYDLMPDADRGWPQSALESAADEFVGRTVAEQGDAIKRLVGLLMEKRLHGEITATGRHVSDREREDIVSELREHYTRVAFGGGINADARRIADKGLRAYGGDIDG